MDFPNNPTLGQIFEFGNRRWTYTAKGWNQVSAPLTVGDIPALDASKITSGTFGVARGAVGLTALETGGYLRAASSATYELRTPAQVLIDIGALGVDAFNGANILSRLIPVSGSGSDLDADRLDGLDATAFLRSNAANAIDFRFTPGDGRGMRFWDSDSYKIFMTSSSNTTWGGRMPGETTSSHNMHFRMGGGNHGFVFENSYGSKMASIHASGIRTIGNLWASGATLTSHVDMSTSQSIRWPTSGIRDASTAGFVLYSDNSPIFLRPGGSADSSSEVRIDQSNVTYKGQVVYHAGNFNASNYMATSWTLSAGNGLTGGGNGTANRSLTLGTPSTLSGSTTNSVTATSHTHALSANLTAWDGVSPADYATTTALTSGLAGQVSKAGDTMTGELILPASTTSLVPLNIPHGATPATLTNGDIWTTTSGVIARINGSTRTLAHTSTWGEPSQAEAEAGTATSTRLWTAQRDRQAIVAYAPGKDGTDATGTWGIGISGNAATATKLAAPIEINGVPFDGSANITVSASISTLTFGNGFGNGSFNGSGNVTMSLGTPGTLSGSSTNSVTSTSHTHALSANLTAWDAITPSAKLDATASAVSANTLTTARTINGTSFNGSANITTANWGTARTITLGGSGKSVNGSADVTWTAAELIGGQGIGNAAVGFGNSYTTPVAPTSNNNGIMAGNGDSASATTNNLRLFSWYGLGFSPSIAGATIPQWEYSHYFNVRNGDMNWRGVATGNGSGITNVAAEKLATPRTINGVAFDGTANITINAVIADGPTITGRTWFDVNNGSTAMGVIREYGGSGITFDAVNAANNAFAPLNFRGTALTYNDQTVYHVGNLDLTQFVTKAQNAVYSDPNALRGTLSHAIVGGTAMGAPAPWMTVWNLGTNEWRDGQFSWNFSNGDSRHHTRVFFRAAHDAESNWKPWVELWKASPDTIPNNANLNTYDLPGDYHQPANASAATGTNYPIANAGMLSVHATSNMVYQRYRHYASSREWTRTRNDNVWQPWKEVATGQPLAINAASTSQHTNAGHSHAIDNIRETGIATIFSGSGGSAGANVPGLYLYKAGGFCFSTNDGVSVRWDANGTMTTGAVPWARLTDVPSYLNLSAAGHQSITGSVSSPLYTSSNGDTGEKYRVGNDASLWDVGIAHTIGVRSTTNANLGYIQFGTGHTFGWNGSQLQFNNQEVWTNWSRPQLGRAAYTVGNWDDANENGWYMAAGAVNTPVNDGNWFMGKVTRHNGDWIQQEAWQFTGDPHTRRYRRHKNGGVWTAWNAETNVSILTADNVNVGYYSGYGQSIGCSNWFRSINDTGWYNASYGGGIYMTDTTYVRAYNGKQMAAADFVISSDIRLKEEITPFRFNGRLRPVNFKMRETGEWDFGFIADEVAEFYPEAVGVIRKDGGLLDGKMIKQLSYQKLTAVISFQVNRLEDEVVILKRRVKTLEATIESQEARLRKLEEELMWAAYS